MARSLRSSFLLIAILVLAASALGQSTPQLARDYVYGPGGRLAVTIEPDNYEPTMPSISASAGSCQQDGVNVSWGGSTDVGSGLAGYNIYRNSQLIYSGSGTSLWDDPWEGTYTYEAAAFDNAGHQSPYASAQVWVPPYCMYALSSQVSRRRQDGRADSILQTILFGSDKTASRSTLFPRAFRESQRLREPLLMAQARPRITPTLFEPARVLPRSLRTARTVQAASPRGGK